MSTSTKWLRKRLDALERGFLNGPSTANLYDGVSSSPLYCLPSELRYYVLRLAFGDKTVNPGILIPDSLIKPVEICDSSLTENWRDGVSDCRHPPRGTPQEDICGQVLSERYYSKFPHFKSKPLGIMGWLCSCRLGFYFTITSLLLPLVIHEEPLVISRRCISCAIAIRFIFAVHK